MGPPDDSKIEKTLRKLARGAVKSREEVTVNNIRRRAEEKLSLEAKFLDGESWKLKSKKIIKAAFEEAEDEIEQAPEKAETAKKGNDEIAEAQTRDKEGREPAQSASPGREKSAAQAPKRPENAAPKINGVKRKASETESASESPSIETSSSSRAPQKLANKKSKKDAAATASPKPGSPDEGSSSSDSGESSGGASESGEESSAASSPNLEDKPSPSKPPNQTPKESSRVIPGKAFKPPSGYIPVDSTVLSGHPDFASTALQGKQIWHITAPSNVPLSSIGELALSSIFTGEPVLTHKDVPYVLAEDATVGAESITLLAPSKEGYVKAHSKVSRTLHLQQKIELPNLSALQTNQATGSNAAGDLAQAPTSTVRPQPKGLRMRYKPPGFGKGRPGRMGSVSGSSDDDADDAGPSFQFPKTLGQHGVQIRQSGDVERVDAAEVDAGENGIANKAAKTSNKKHKENTGGDNSKVNGLSKDEADKARISPPNGTVLENGQGAEKESKEEKRRRKEEKRARKKAKTKAKEVAA